jgi:hypothetical protein
MVTLNKLLGVGSFGFMVGHLVHDFFTFCFPLLNLSSKNSIILSMPFNGQKVDGLSASRTFYLLIIRKQRERRKKQISFFSKVLFFWQNA